MSGGRMQITSTALPQVETVLLQELKHRIPTAFN
jgi:hypothetical protein